LSRGDIVLIAHGDWGKPRPAIVVQADELGEGTTTVLVCPLTSEVTQRLPLRPSVEPGADTGLRVRSQVMTDKMLAVPRARIRRVLGALGSPGMDEIDRALLVVLGLTR
jgi:mRNA interferase MazF